MSAFSKLRPKHAAFVLEYCKDKNATQAYIRAGYSAKGADVAGPRLCGNVGVAAAIKEVLGKAAAKNEVTVERIVAEYAKMAFANIGDLIEITEDGSARVDLTKATSDHLAAISEVTSDVYIEGGGDDAQPVKRTKIKMTDKRAALSDLGRHLEMFVEVSKRVGQNNEPIDEMSDHEFIARLAFALDPRNAGGGRSKV